MIQTFELNEQRHRFAKELAPSIPQSTLIVVPPVHPIVFDDPSRILFVIADGCGLTHVAQGVDPQQHGAGS